MKDECGWVFFFFFFFFFSFFFFLVGGRGGCVCEQPYYFEIYGTIIETLYKKMIIISECQKLILRNDRGDKKSCIKALLNWITSSIIAKKGVRDSVGISHRSASPRPTTLEEDRELFVNFSLILCLWFEIQDLRAYNFFDWISNTGEG